MRDTKELILTTALELFARGGYEAVSVSEIAGALGMTKGALYKHYQNKRDIFDHIVERMSQMDFERARAFEMPEGMLAQTAQAYAQTPLETIRVYSVAQFKYWTEEPFSANFRKLLTLEQYRSPEMASLYQQYLASGPLSYVSALFSVMTKDAQKGDALGLAYYAPIFLLYSVYDGADEKPPVFALLENYIEAFNALIRKEYAL